MYKEIKSNALIMSQVDVEIALFSFFWFLNFDVDFSCNFLFLFQCRILESEVILINDLANWDFFKKQYLIQRFYYNTS